MTLEVINATLDALIPHTDSVLHQAARYSLEGGKRLRPLLLLSVLESVGHPVESGLYPACALELIHTYSLIHDDLPCMDNDDFRRGKPTLHQAYPENLALLVGDFLLTYAFEVLSLSPDLDIESQLALVKLLSKAAGAQGMIGGQLLDITDSEDWELQHEKKTGALITCAFLFGGKIAAVDQKILQQLGMTLGKAYQLVDDLIDGDGVVLLKGRQAVESEVAKLDQHLTALLDRYPGNPAPILEIASKMIHRTV